MHWSYSRWPTRCCCSSRTRVARGRDASTGAVRHVVHAGPSEGAPSSCGVRAADAEPYEGFDDAGALEVRREAIHDRYALADILTNLGPGHHAGEAGANRATSRADTLPGRRATIRRGGGHEREAVAEAERREGGAGSFRRRRARVFKLFAAVALRRSPRNSRVPFEPRRPRAAIEARGAAAERSRGSSLPRTRPPWAVATLVKSVVAAARATEEWLRAVRGRRSGRIHRRGRAGNSGRRRRAPGSRRRRRATGEAIRGALMCVAQLVAAIGVRFQSALLAELAAEGETTALAHDSRAAHERRRGWRR